MIVHGTFLNLEVYANLLLSMIGAEVMLKVNTPYVLNIVMSKEITKHMD